MKFIITSLLTAITGYSLTVQANEPCPQGQFLSKDGICYPKIFVPTYEYQELVEGQTILGDDKLDVQMSMKTGIKKAKILVQNSNTENQNQPSVHSAFTGINFHEAGGRQEAFTNQPASPQPRLEDMSDHQRFAYYISQVNEYPNDNTKIGDALTGLEDMVHEAEFGEKLFKDNEAVKRLTNFLEPQWPSFRRSRVAVLLGSALQNNPKAQKEAHKVNVVAKLHSASSNETDPGTLSHLIYAISASVRGDIVVLKSFHEAKGLTTLSEIYGRHVSAAIDQKIMLLLSDINNPDLQPTAIVGATDPGSDRATNFAEHDGAILHDIASWCTSIQASFQSHPTEKIESEISALANLVHVYPTTCQVATGFPAALNLALDDIKSYDYYEEYTTNLQALHAWVTKSQ